MTNASRPPPAACSEFGEAEQLFLQCLGLRQQLPSDGRHAVAKAQALAQVHVSLGNMYTEWNNASEGGVEASHVTGM